MLGTYASLALILAASAVVGQAVFAISGRREVSTLAPAVGLAVLVALAWGTVRLPGEGTAAAIALGVATLASLAYLPGRIDGLREALRVAVPVALAGTAAASLPFIVEGRIGILGTGLNPDMSQHLFAAHQLANGGTERLVDSGYPLGPHSLVVAVSALGPSLVHAFDGLTLAVAVAAVLAPLGILRPLLGWRIAAAGLLVGLPYMAASYLIQGAFKETMEALFVLAFVIGLHGLAIASSPQGEGERRILCVVPLAALAVGAVYAYSFPGLFWLAGAAALWALLARPRGLVRPAGFALAIAALAVAPEIGRMVDFATFETFDPAGAGLGNLFNRISPLEALGIWPSGDFRLDPGDGAAPAFLYYAGGALGLMAMGYGLAWWVRRREFAVPAALVVAGVLVLYPLVSGTAYQEAKAIVIAAPLAMLVAARPLAGELRVSRRGGSLATTLLAVAFFGAATGCSLVALANGPVGPSPWGPALTQLRGELGRDSTLVLAPAELLADEHGRDFLVWELRGGRVCVEEAGPPSGQPPPRGVSNIVSEGVEAPFAGLKLKRRAGPYVLWTVQRASAGPGPCPLIAPGARANPAGD